MSTIDTAALCLRHVTKQYSETQGIFNITLDVQPGEVFGFLGPNGAGKSTTINTILDLLRADEGDITIFGLDHRKDARAAHARIGYLSGDMATDDTLTGAQYLNYVMHLRKVKDRTIIPTLTERLKADLTTKIKHLSRGNKQKIGLIAALMHDPDLLILDEPTSGLDPLIQAEFFAILEERKRASKTTFMSSHILSEVQSVCDRVGFIRQGKLMHVDQLDHLLAAAPQEVTLHFTATPPVMALRHLPGMHHAQQQGNIIRFDFTGDPNQLLKLLAGHRLKSLTMAEPDLEKLFMKYYDTEAPHAA